MAIYDVTLEVDGVLRVSVEAESEDEAARKARHLAVVGSPEGTLEYECVKVTLQGQP